VWSTEQAFEKWRVPAPAKAAIGGLLVGCIGIWLPEVFGSSYGAINASFAGTLGILLMIGLLVAKIAATSITLGSGGSGGVFAPSLFLGAMLGGTFGTIVHGAFPTFTASSGAFALVGLGAVVAAATHAPITAILLIFEMTQSVSIIAPLMVACVLATLTAMFLRRESIYTLSLVHKGLDVYTGKDPNVLRTLPARGFVDRAPAVIREDADFGAVLDLLLAGTHDELFVTDAEERLLGAISLDPLRRMLGEEPAFRNLVVAQDMLETGRPIVFEDDDLDTVAQQLRSAGVSELAVVTRADPTRLVGSISERVVLEAYHREMLRRDLAGGMGTRVSLANRGREVDLGDGYALAEFEAPLSFHDRSLRELDLGSRHGVQVLLLRSRTPLGETVRVPTADDRIGAGDRLVVAGTSAALSRLDQIG
jgi:CIC family chloride channel protein